MVALKVVNLNIWFGGVHALRNLSMEIQTHQIMTIIGPSNSGKTTFLRALNRLGELNPALKQSGTIYFGDKNLQDFSAEEVHRRIGMVFALPLPLPLSIFENVAYGLRMHKPINKRELKEKVQRALEQAYLWEEVKDRLKDSAFKLSGGQQQRLCIARTLALEPDVILFDEPCSGLDPISTSKVEEAMRNLKERYALVLVTNNVKQAARVGDRTAFFLGGELIELGETQQIFTAPKDERTDGYIRGKFG